jgi:hypothetical protein
MSILRPVSSETLASIPWMSAKTLSHTMREVSLRGPNERPTWTQLVSRADVIVESFNPKQASLVLNSITRVRQIPELDGLFNEYYRRHISKFLEAIVREMSSLDVAQTLHALGEWVCVVRPSETLIKTLEQSFLRNVASMDDRSLSMACHGVSNLGLFEQEIVSAVLSAAVNIGEGLSDRTLGQILNHSTLASKVHANDRQLINQLGSLAVQRLGNMNFRTFVLVLNSLAKLRADNPDVMHAVAEVVRSANFLKSASLQQLIVVLRSIQKLNKTGINPPEVYRLLDVISTRPLQFRDANTPCTLLNAITRVAGYDRLCNDCLRSMNGLTLAETHRDSLVRIFDLLPNSPEKMSFTVRLRRNGDVALSTSQCSSERS